MRVRFWGTRGSIAKPGATTVRYGGNTSCVEVRSNSGTLVILDCGTGAHGLGAALLEESGEPRDGFILITHTHWDHIQGFPFFAPQFGKHDRWRVYGPGGRGPSLRDTFSGQMQYNYFPVSIDQLQAKVEYQDLTEGTFDVGDIRVTAQLLNHPSPTLGYRLEVDGLVVVYATDHEPHMSELAAGGRPPVGGEDERHIHFCRDADLLIHDTQYTADEYPAKKGWGHSTIEYAVDSALAAQAETLALFHHDPLRHDNAVDELLCSARERVNAARGSLKVIAATEGEAMQLMPGDKARAKTGMFPAALVSDADRPDLEDGKVLLAIDTDSVRAHLRGAAEADGLAVVQIDPAEPLDLAIRREEPNLVMLERRRGGGDALELCAGLRAQPDTPEGLPVVVVADDAAVDRVAGRKAGVSDWLIVPCSPQFARARIHAWLLRSACRWERAPTPRDEERRLASLRRLALLDTRAEERFDRYTRIAAALFDVPVALVSLIDRDRQWFKSRIGLDTPETHRDMAFCAHAIMGPDLLLIEDARSDARFAENPLVTDRQIRFYAGAPLAMADGSRAGTLCLMDHAPRRLSGHEQTLLRDLGNLVQRELNAKADP